MLLASFFKTRDRMMGIGQAITMPLLLRKQCNLSNFHNADLASVCIKVQPTSTMWLTPLRAMLLTGNYSNLPVDIGVFLISTFAFIALASMALRRIIE